MFLEAKFAPVKQPNMFRRRWFQNTSFLLKSKISFRSTLPSLLNLETFEFAVIPTAMFTCLARPKRCWMIWICLTESLRFLRYNHGTISDEPVLASKLCKDTLRFMDSELLIKIDKIVWFFLNPFMDLSNRMLKSDNLPLLNSLSLPLCTKICTCSVKSCSLQVNLSTSPFKRSKHSVSS